MTHSKDPAPQMKLCFPHSTNNNQARDPSSGFASLNTTVAGAISSGAMIAYWPFMAQIDFAGIEKLLLNAGGLSICAIVSLYLLRELREQIKARTAQTDSIIAVFQEHAKELKFATKAHADMAHNLNSLTKAIDDCGKKMPCIQAACERMNKAVEYCEDRNR